MDHSSNKVASKRPLVELQDADLYNGGGASSLILRQVAIMEEEAKPSCSSKRLHMDSFHEIPSNLLKNSSPSSAPTPLILQGSLIAKLDEDKTSLESQITKLDDGKASLESVLQKHDEAAATSRSEVKINTDCSYNLPGNQGLEELIINFDDLQNGAGADQNYGSGACHGHLQVNLADCLLDQSAWDDDGMGDLLSALSNFNEGSNPVVHSSYLIGNDEGDNCCLSDNPNYGDNCIRLWNEVPDQLPDWMTLSTVAANLDNL